MKKLKHLLISKVMKTKSYLFSGKGGVGKTTMSVATAINYANEGLKTLIITTDPASNLADVFEQKIGHDFVPIQNVPNLYAMELDPDKATEEYKERTLAPLRGLIPFESFTVLEEQLNSPCTAEMATFEKFTDFVQENELDVVVFDTAPTGHTLRLLQLPVEWSEVIENASKDGSSGQTCIGPAAALAKSKEKFDNALKIMRDSTRTSFIFVLKPEATSIFEVKRTLDELAQVGIKSYELIVNGLLRKEICNNSLFVNRFNKQQEFLSEINSKFKAKIRLVHLFDSEIVGVKKLEMVAEQIFKNENLLTNYRIDKITSKSPKYDLVNKQEDNNITSKLFPHNGNPRKVFFAGKGGVGKSSVASATAVWIAEKRFKTLLLTTDPASHLSQIFDQKIGNSATQVESVKNLSVTFVDTKAVTQDYKEKILADSVGKYDESRLIAIKEELDSPCTEEMATFEKFIDYASNKDYDVIVFDTAPTGHTLRLLELPIDWNKQLEIKTFVSMEETEVDRLTKSRFKEVIDSLQDPNQTTFSFVMYPERTPIEEATRAIEELLGIGIPTSLIVANMVVEANLATNDFLLKRHEMQRKYLELMDKRFTAPIISLPLMENDIIGIEELKKAGKYLYGN